MNYYHLKGILDAGLPKDYSCQKDLVFYVKSKIIWISNKYQEEERIFLKHLVLMLKVD